MKQLTQRGLPLYYQIEEQLRTRIDSGEWTEGVRIPSELELAQTYGVSRATIRQAISNLESSGFLRRKQGLGTFVSTPTFKGDYLRFFFPEELGYRHSVLHCSLCEGTPSIHRLLQLPFDTQVVELERLRYFRDDTEPAVLEKSYMRAALYPVLQSADLSQKLYGLVEKALGLSLFRSENIIEPVLPTVEEAGYLHITPASPVLLISRVAFSDKNEPVILTKCLIRADKCKLLVTS